MLIKEINNQTKLSEEDFIVLKEHFLQNYTEQGFANFLSKDYNNVKILGLFEDSELISFLMLGFSEEEQTSIISEDKLCIERVFTKEKYRNKGYAKKLITHAHQIAKEEFKKNEIWLDSAQAGKFYENFFNYEYQFSVPWKNTKTKVYMKKI